MAEFRKEDEPRTAFVSSLIGGYGGALRSLRILDLACRTGAFSYALAVQGHHALGLEGRQANLNEAHEHANIEYHLGDVRDLSVEKYGMFDVALCLGLLYHLTAEDSLQLLRSLAEITVEFAILDTHVSTGSEVVVVEGQTLYGHAYAEGNSAWSSIGNQTSWWFTVESLCQLANMAGWEILPLAGPPGEAPDRRWFILHDGSFQ